MEEITINRHSFHNAVENLDKRIKQRPEDVAELPKFEEKALKIFDFSFIDRNITGKEMNSFVSTLQETLIDSNIIIEGALNEIKSIYTALDNLDKDYIDGILDAIKKAKNAIDKAEKSLSQVKKNSEQNTQTLQALKLTVEQFKSFRDKVNQALPLIPKHTEALDRLRGVVDKTSVAISTWDKQFVKFQKDAEDKTNKELASVKTQLRETFVKAQKDTEEKAAKELASAKTQLGETIVKAQKDTEEKAAKELASAKAQLGETITKAQKEAEEKAAKELASAKAQLGETITKAQKEAEDKAAHELASAKTQLGETITKAQKNSEDKVTKELASLKDSFKSEIENNSRLRRKLLYAYLIGGLGLITSIVTLLLSF